MPGKDDLSITLTSLWGNADLFVNSDGLLPSEMYYTWSAETDGSETLTIPASDPKACRNCRYYVGVLGAASATAYTITTRLRETLVTLQAEMMNR